MELNIFSVIDKRIKSYLQTNNLLPHKTKSTFRYQKQSIPEFYMKYALDPADKTANNIVIVWRLQPINTLKQELSGTKAFKEISEEEKSVVFGHSNHLVALNVSVNVTERHDKLPAMYTLP